MEKYVLDVAGLEAKEAFIMEQLFVGMEAGIKDGIHYMRILWK